MEEEIIETEETTNYDKLRYILDKDGYVCHASLGGLIICDLGECTEYLGEVPSGYSSIEEWYDGELEKINAWKIVDGNLVYDEQKYNELQNQYEIDNENNSCASHKWVNDKLNQSTTIYDDNFSTETTDLYITNSNDSEIPEIIIEGKGSLTEASGSSIYVDDAREGNAKELVIEGKSEQETSTQGKNLLNITDGKNETIDGVTFTYQDDGNIILNGTSTKAIAHYNYLTNFKLPAGTYTHSTTNDLVTGLYVSLNNISETMLNTLKKQTSWTLGSETTYTNYLIYIGSGITFNNYVITPQIEKGSSATTYEPFIPNMPSPDYPSEIKTIPSVRNLFDKDNANILDAFVDTSVNVISQTTANIKTLYIPIIGGKTYTISKVKSDAFRVATTINVPALNVAIDNKISNDSATSITLTTNSTANYLVVSYYRGLSDTLTEQEILDSIMIEEGSIAHNYVPYGTWTKVKTTGKNLLNIKNETYTTGGITATSNNGVITIKGKNTTGSAFLISFSVNSKLPSSTRCTFSATDENSTDETYALRYYLGTNSLTTYNKDKTQVTDESGDKFTLQVRIGVNATVDTKLYPMVRLAIDENPTYETYKEKEVLIDLQGNELCSIRDTKDELNIIDGQVVINKKIGKIVLNGSETWGYNSSNGNRYINGTGFLPQSKGGKCISSHYPYNIEVEKSIWIGESTFLIIRDNDFTTTSFKTWLSENNVTVYYILAEPQQITLPNTNIELFEGANHITLVDDLETNMTCTYINQITTFEDGLKLHVTNENVLINEAISSTLNGLTMTINDDKTISIKGTATADTEFILNGSADNVEPIFMLNNSNQFVVSGLDTKVILNLYNYNGTDRELVYSGTSGNIVLGQPKCITCSTLQVANGTTIDATVKPMILKADELQYIERNVVVGEDLSGKTLYFDFPDNQNYSGSVTDTTALIQCDGGTKRRNAIVLMPSTYSSSGESGTFIYADIDDEYTDTIYKVVNGTTTKMSSLTLPSNFGVVQSIESTEPFNYIKIREYNYKYVEAKANEFITTEPFDLKQDEYIRINRSCIDVIGKDETTLKVIEPLHTFKTNTLIQTNSNDVSLTTKYFTNEYINERISKIEREQDSITLEVAKKVDEDDYTGASILLKINEDESEATINADKIKLEGYTTINNGFSVDLQGNAKMNNADVNGKVVSSEGNIGGWTINNNGLTNGTVFINNDGSSTIYTVADLIIVRGYIMGITGFELSSSMINHYDFNGDGVVNTQDYITLQNLIGIPMG